MFRIRVLFLPVLFFSLIVTLIGQEGSVAENEPDTALDTGVIAMTKQDFLDNVFDYENEKEWKFKGKLPAIIDFYADWCGPCVKLTPILEELSSEYAGKVNIYKIDTEVEQELTHAFGIESIPSILFIPKDGQPQIAQGALTRDAMLDVMKNVLKIE